MIYMGVVIKDKKWYESTTIWINLIGVIVIVLEYFVQSNLIDPEIGTIILGAINMLNRVRGKESTPPIEKAII